MYHNSLNQSLIIQPLCPIQFFTIINSTVMIILVDKSFFLLILISPGKNLRNGITGSKDMCFFKIAEFLWQNVI